MFHKTLVVCFLYTSIFISSLLYSKEDFLYVCCIFKNEARFLDEWINFHLHQGADKIYMYNNGSEDDYEKVIQDYIVDDKVILIDWNYTYSSIQEWNSLQCKAYMDCIKRVKEKVKWVAFIDTDEFLFSPTGKTLRKIIKEYRHYDAIGANWVMYGSSNITQLENSEKLTDKMVFRAPLDYSLHNHIKTIVRPEKVLDCVNPHFFIMTKNSKSVDENKEETSGPFSKINSVKKLRINHYWARDLDFLFGEKLRRQSEWVNRTKEDLMEADKKINLEFDPILKNFEEFH